MCLSGTLWAPGVEHELWVTSVLPGSRHRAVSTPAGGVSPAQGREVSSGPLELVGALETAVGSESPRVRTQRPGKELLPLKAYGGTVFLLQLCRAVIPRVQTGLLSKDGGL